ncbi:hypothetical protein CO656_23720 [Sinorhizobium sp. FG01]|uniref:Uncharacterized protein n=1 Tax=Sinorhizobium americanum TaxID=194963 RepID=A0A2S3YTR2_9HYPH|nr:hypothetical protein CO656_23720 [Sinorhizobium sp. FG01]POH35032.1 hypothetical protein ATY31_04595 [Sinorhizobium americanum]
MLLPRVDGILQKQFDRARHREACTVLADKLASRLELSGQEVLDALACQDQNRLSGGRASREKAVEVRCATSWDLHIDNLKVQRRSFH